MLNKGAQARHSRNIPLRITHPSHSLPLSQAAQHSHFHLPSSSQPEAKTTESKRRKEAREEEGSRRARAAAATTALNHRRPSGPCRQRQEPEDQKHRGAPRPPGQHHQHTTATIQTQPIWWTFLLVTVYFAFATAISAHGCWVYSKKRLRKADESHGFLNGDVENRDLSTSISGERKRDEMDKKTNYYEQIANEKKAGFWGRCMQIIYQTSAGATMLTDVTFWGLLVPFFYRDKFGFDMVTDGMHSLNAVFLLIDTVLNNMPFPWYRMGFFVFWSCSYVTFQWVLHACGGLSWWPYPFLDLSSSGAPLWYLAMAVAHIPCFFLYWLIVKAKHTYFPRLFPHAYVRTNKSDPSSNYGPYVQ